MHSLREDEVARTVTFLEEKMLIKYDGEHKSLLKGTAFDMNSIKQLVISTAVLAGTAAVLLGCTVQPVADTRSTSAQEAGSTAPPVDYASAENWLSAPVTITQPVDVFYLYPTSFQRAASDAPVIATIDDPGMRQRATSGICAAGNGVRNVGQHLCPLLSAGRCAVYAGPSLGRAR